MFVFGCCRYSLNILRNMAAPASQQLPTVAPAPAPTVKKQLKVADVFCGIGSFTIAAEQLDMRSVWACDNEPHVQKVYQAHFGVMPDGDITEVDPATVPDHDIMCAGFPCQPFSTIGAKKGSNEQRGRVLDYAIDIIRAKRPRAVILENVRGLITCNGGEDFRRVEASIRAAGYDFQYKILQCEDFGIPQRRHRVFMVCFRDGKPTGFKFPEPLKVKRPTLSEFLGVEVVKPLAHTVRCSGRHSPIDSNKNWSLYKTPSGGVFTCTLEHAQKLQGFPPNFKWADVAECHKWKMIGNTVPVCLSVAILKAVRDHLFSAPEEPPLPLPAVTQAHLPPARKIMQELDDEIIGETLKKRRMMKEKEEEEEKETSEKEEESSEEESSDEKEEKKKRKDTKHQHSRKRPRSDESDSSSPEDAHSSEESDDDDYSRRKKHRCHHRKEQLSQQQQLPPPPPSKKATLQQRPVSDAARKDPAAQVAIARQASVAAAAGAVAPAPVQQEHPAAAVASVATMVLSEGVPFALYLPDGVSEQTVTLKITKARSK